MVSQTTRSIVWARAAGRCQYPGCNSSLIGDLQSGREDGNFGFVAHIVGEKATGPRGDPERSVLLADDPANLMLLCHRHHKLIDVDGLSEHSEDRLLKIKTAHERRIELVTGIAEERASHLLLYGAKVGAHQTPLSFSEAARAMLPERYPAEGRAIEIEMRGRAAEDSEEAYWSAEIENLQRQFVTKVRGRVETKEIEHLSVFAIAPIPLLVELGRLLGDIVPADVYQRHREPVGWTWAKDGERLQFNIARQPEQREAVALKIALSATIDDKRIRDVLGDNVSIWSVEGLPTGNDCMRYPEDLREFRKTIRDCLNEIRSRYGADTEINVFPAAPVSAALELGRVWMPKADLPLRIYDENRGAGFVLRHFLS